jgi:putative transcriptional regulator
MRNSRIIDEMHETLSDLQAVGALNPQTLRDFELQYLSPPDYGPEDIKKLRDRLQVSQEMFAAYLNAPLITVKQWENGKKRPRGMALRLLSIIDRKGWNALQ